MTEISLGANPQGFDPNSADWKFVKRDPLTGMTTYEAEIEGVGTILRHEYEMTQELWNANQTIRNETDGKRWGDGQIVASIPMNELFGQTYIGQAYREGDEKAMSKYLNDYDNQRYRTKRGTI